jgi:sugar/nucleoside kinase (ribokinase family)
MVAYVTFGILLDDIVMPDGRTFMNLLGGGGAQTAWGMAAALRLPEKVGLFARVGPDFDFDLLRPLLLAGVDLSGVLVTDKPTPRAWQVLENDGQRTQVWRTPYPSIAGQLQKDWESLPPAYQAATWFHWGIHPNEGLPRFAQTLRTRAKRVSLETFKAAESPLPLADRRALFQSCDVFSGTEEELARLSGSLSYQSLVSEFPADGKARYLLVRRGVMGAMVYDFQNKQLYEAPALAVPSVSDLGAGNAFCGAFIARLQDSPKEALAHALTCASFMVEQVGLPPALPPLQTYESRLNSARGSIRVTGLL